MNTPYDAPAVDLLRPAENATSGTPVFIALRGRLGRVRFVVFLLGAVIMLTTALLAFGLLLTVTFIAGALLRFIPLLVMLAWVAACMVYGIRRLNDMNRSGWWVLLSFVPVVNLGLGLYLLFGPGSKEANTYGLPPSRNGAGMMILCCIMVSTVALSTIAGFGIVKLVELSNPR